jgi:hypothetical protein
MPRRSCCRTASAPPAAAAVAAAALTLLAALALAAAAPLHAATVLDKRVEIEIRGDGSVAESNHLEVRLDAPTDLAAWSPFPIAFDERRSLANVHAWVRRPDGTTEKVGRQGFDTVDVAGGEVLHSSDKVRLVRFADAPAGTVLGVDYERAGQPYFPSGRLFLRSHDAAVSHLSVRVRHGRPGGGAGSVAGWRWSILGSTAGLHVSDTPGELLITATDLPRPPRLEHAPDEVSEGPVLSYGWGEQASWAAVGRWYEEIERGLPRDRDEVRQAARRLVAAAGARPEPTGTDSGDELLRRERLESILTFVRREVRYVAVEVGVGGYRPAPPHETLARRWGDCKAKVELLLDLLREAGIAAYPALVLAAPEGRIDPEFPSPFWFNHVIAALPTASLALGADDPVAGGYLFVDPTQTRGGAGWLHPADQDQLALVLRGDHSALVRTPLRPQLEASHLTIDLTARPDGSAAGRLRLELRGSAAAELADRLAAERPEIVDADSRRLIAAWLPTASVSQPRWLPEADSVGPTAILTAAIALPALFAGGELIPTPSAAAHGAAGSQAAADTGSGAAAVTVSTVALGGPRATPPPGILRDRAEPVVVEPGVEEVTWHIALPDGWCPAQSDTSGLDNAAGAFRQSLSCAAGNLSVDRRTDLRLRWIDPQHLPELAALALAEHRAAARRLRLDRLHG